MTRKFKDYLLGSQFTAYTDNNPCAYVKGSKLGAAQIRWLSELAVKVQNVWLVGIEWLIPNGPMLVPRQLRFSLYSGAVITEGLM